MYILKFPYLLLLSFAGALSGATSGVISGTMVQAAPFLEDTSEEYGWMSYAAPVVGSITAACCVDSVGRKRTILGADALLVVGALIMSSSQNTIMTAFSHVLIGIGLGLSAVSAPLYLAEVSPTPIRGGVISLSGVFISFGNIIPYLINLCMYKVEARWRIMFVLAAVPPLIQSILMTFLPESPQMLFKELKFEEVHEFFKRIYTADVAKEEFKRLKAYFEAAKASEGSIGQNIFMKFWKAVTITEVRWALLAGVIVQVIPQVVGMNTVLFYSPYAMEFAGITSKAASLALECTFQTFGSCLTTLIVDRYGRCKVLVFSLVAICVSLLCIGAIFYNHSIDDHLGKVGVILVILFGIYSIVYSASLGTLPWVINAELYTLSFRGFGGGMGAVAGWLTNLVVSITEPQGSLGRFFLHAAFSLLGLLGIVWFVPETGGVSLEDLETVFGQKKEVETIGHIQLVST